MQSRRNNRRRKRSSNENNSARSLVGETRAQTKLIRQLVDMRLVDMASAPPMVRDIVFRPIPRNQTYLIRRSYDAGTITSSTVGAVVGGLEFSLSQMPDYTEFSALFDSYRFDEVRVTFIPNSPTGSTPLRFYTVLDYDDVNVTSFTVSSAEEYDSCMISAADSGKAVVRTLRPKFAVASYSGSFTSYAQASGWCDAASPGIQWYGVKYALPQATTQQTVYQVEVEARLMFRSTR